MDAMTGCANGLCENTATKIIGYTNSGGPRGRRCRHAGFVPANNASLLRVLTELDPSELDPSWSKLSSGVIPAIVESLIPSEHHFVYRSLCARPPKPHGCLCTAFSAPV